MTNPSQNATTSTSKGNAEPEKMNRQPSYEYLPMNVFVDPRTIRDHFQGLSTRAR